MWLFCGSPIVAQVKQFDVPAQDAGKSVPELARQAGIQVIAPGEQLHGIVTPPVKGTYDVIAALNLMLKGTGLVVSRSADGIVTISLPETKDQGEREEMLKGQKNSVSVFALLFGALAITPAHAQADQQLETVVVTGMRASLANALEVKKNSDQFIDSIVSEDIGKLPDNQVVDALQHVSGLQVQHGNGTGENDQIWIRGLPDIGTTLNGRQLFTTTGRFMSLADVPAELLQRLDVHKSGQANDIEGGLAGLVDVRLHRPFDFDGRQIAGGVHALYGTVSGHIDPEASILASNRWNTKIGEFGVLFDVSYVKQHYQDENAFDYWSNATVTNGTTTAKTPGTLGGIQYPGGRERGSADLSMQWRPNTNLEVYAEVFYTRYRNAHEVNFLIGLPGNNNPVTSLTTVTDPDGIVNMKTTSECCFVLTSNQAFHDSTNTYQWATGATWTTGNVTLTSEFNYTDSRYKHNGFIVDTAIFVETEYDSNYKNGGTPWMGSSDLAAWKTSSNYHPTQLFDQWTKQEGNEYDWRGDANFAVDSSWLKSVDAGVRYANRYGKNRQDWGGAISCYSGTDEKGADAALVASAACNGGSWWGNAVDTIFPGLMTNNHGAFMEGEKPWGVQNWMNASASWMFANVAKLRAGFGQATTDPNPDLSNSFDDREESFAAYIKANIAATLGSMPLTGNIGVRVVDTQSQMNAYVTSVDVSGNKSYTATQKGHEDTDLMPSLNAKLEVQDNLYVRLGLGRTVTRPTFAALNPGLYLSATALTSNNSGSSGNPNLRPVKANNLDLAVEYYFGKANAVTLSLFHRQISGYIQSIIDIQTYGGQPYAITHPVNSGVGHLQGAELGYTQWLDFLPGAWGGFGIQTNGTFIEGRFTDITAVGGKHPYSGVSKYSFNLIPMYEYGPVSIRASYNWRSSYQVGYTFHDSASTNPAEVWTKPYGELSASASYTFNEHLVLTFDASNVLDSIYQDTFGKGAYASVYPRDSRHYDQIYRLGARFKL